MLLKKGLRKQIWKTLKECSKIFRIQKMIKMGYAKKRGRKLGSDWTGRKKCVGDEKGRKI